MKIVTWNCNLSLSKKLEPIFDLKPDLAIIQECEQDLQGIPDEWHYLWFGQNPKKGIGVISTSGLISVDSIFKDSWTYFLPINVNEGQIRLLATWAYNHRADRFGADKMGRPLDVFSEIDKWTGAGKLIVAGDFNNSVVWDKKKGNNNFTDIAAYLENRGVLSSYHRYYAEEFGGESRPTFYHTKNKEKGFHIDYIFCCRSLGIDSVSVGEHDDWISYSDHMPVITAIQTDLG